MQVRWVDQTQYPMIVVASLSAVPQSCRTPLPNQYLDCMLLAVYTHTWPLNMRGKSVRSVLALRIDRKGLFQGNSKVIVCCNVSRCKLGSHTGTPTLSKYLAPDREIRMIQQILHQARNITQSNSHILFRLFSPRSLKNTKNPFQTNNMWLHNCI